MTHRQPIPTAGRGARVRAAKSVPTMRRALLAATILAAASGGGTALAASPGDAGAVSAQDLMRSLLRPSAGPAAPAPAAMQDLGAAPDATPIHMTMYLKPRDPAALEAFDAALQTPGGGLFHRFITEATFVDRFAPTEATVQSVEATLEAEHFTITDVFANRLAIRFEGSEAAVEAAFSARVHRFALAGHVVMRPTAPIRLPAAIAPDVRAIDGLDTPGLVRPASAPAESDLTLLENVTLDPALAAASGVTDRPGELRPVDYEKLYDVMPLVAAGANGAGETVGIVTTQVFPLSDPQTFWKNNDIDVSASHLQVRYVDEATQASLDEADPDTYKESDLDTEQSGAVAPMATVLAYSSTSLLDGFEQAASDNRADVVTTSFDKFELLDQDNSIGAANAGQPLAYHDVLLEMAAQGQTVFAASGDGGAFAANRNEAGYFQVFPTIGGPASYTPIYSVGAIVSDPLVTAAGATTLPITGTFEALSPGFTVTIAQEQPWSTSDLPLAALAETGDLDEVETLFEAGFPGGSGGGVSALWPVPDYQRGLAGIATTQPFQALIALGGTPTVLATEPAFYAGRNLPDLSANADPNSGYFHYVGGRSLTHGGGTSVVAPQFAGTLALIDQRLGHRVGQLNPLLYRLQASGAAPAREITTGNNWGYVAHQGYNQATGLGAMDAERLYSGLQSFD